MTDQQPALRPPGTTGPLEFDPPTAAVLDAEVLAGQHPSPRARRAEALAQVVLGDDSDTAPLRALVRRAAEVTGAENGQISIISTRQIAVMVERGNRRPPGDGGGAFAGMTTSFEDTLCAVSVRADAPVAVPDARRDSRVASVPAVVHGVVGAYLGCPLRARDGSVIGVLCVYDAAPHDWSAAETRALDLLAAEVSAGLAVLDPANAAVPS